MKTQTTALTSDLLKALQKYESARARLVIHKDGSVTVEMDFDSLAAANQAAREATRAVAAARKPDADEQF